jgi:hypothetical protein
MAHLELVTLIVAEYDAAITFFVDIDPAVATGLLASRCRTDPKARPVRASGT